jgi:hypothetical protein
MTCSLNVDSEHNNTCTRQGSAGTWVDRLNGIQAPERLGALDVVVGIETLRISLAVRATQPLWSIPGPPGSGIVSGTVFW